MKNSFIFGMVWLAIIVGLISFGATVFFLDNKDDSTEASFVDSQDFFTKAENDNEIINELKSETNNELKYETNQTAIRTNEITNSRNFK